MKNKYKRKIINRINRLIKFLYNYSIALNVVDSDDFNPKDKLALLEFDAKLRAAGQKLIDDFDK